MDTTKTCQNCKHFTQHYAYDRDKEYDMDTQHGFYPLAMGHCTEPDFKYKGIFDNVCDKFEREEDFNE